MKISLLEGHYTQTRYLISSAFKLTLVKTINIGLIPILNHTDTTTWFSPWGLAEDCFYNILFFIFGEVVYTFIDFPHFIKLGRRQYYKYLGNQCSMTQIQANTFWENNPIMISKRYSMVLILLLLSLFYGPIYPGVSLQCLVGLFFMEVVIRYILLRRCTFKIQIGKGLPQWIADFIPAGIFLYSLMNFLFYRAIKGESSFILLTTMIISAVFFIFPFKRNLLRYMFISDVKRKTTDFYREHVNDFKHYDLLNPITKIQGI